MPGFSHWKWLPAAGLYVELVAAVVVSGGVSSSEVEVEDGDVSPPQPATCDGQLQTLK